MSFGKFLKKAIGVAAPLSALIPGVGLPLAVALGAGGGLISGGGLAGAISGGLGAAALSPGAGSALGTALGATSKSAAGALGTGLLGAGAGAATGGLKGALLGGTAGAAGGYLGNGGASELLGGTQVGNYLGLDNPAAGSALGNFLGSDTAAGTGSVLGGLNNLSNAGSAYANAPDISSNLSLGSQSTNALTGVGKDFASGITGSGSSGGLASALTTGIGGGGSTYAGGSGGSSYGTIGASLLGGLNSINANDKAQKYLLNAQNNALSAIAPYQASGNAANSRLSELLGTGGNTTADGYGSLSNSFSADDLQNDPGYQFQLQQGQQAIDRQQAAKGGYFSGSALKAAQDYGQGLADSTLNQAFQRDQSQKQQTYGMFAGQSAAGQGAANTASDLYQGIGNAKAGAGISSANITNQTLSSLLSGSGAKRAVNIGGQIVYI